MMWWLLGVTLAVAAGLTATVVRQARRARELESALGRVTEDLGYLEQAFARFAPDGVVEQLSEGAEEIPPTRREVTVMFADIAGFTRLSEELDPEIMVPILNDYFRRMSRVVRDHHGHVSRIMGDGLMALFGALDLNTWQAADAVKAALAMREELAAYNEELAAKGLPRLRIGIGIHRGDVVAAVVGSDVMMEFTVLGDAVNLAARVESLTRTHEVDLLVTAAVKDALDERFHLHALPPSPVKGKADPVATWTVERYDGAAPTPGA